MTDVVIAGYARSPFTPAKKGALARVRPDDLAAQVVRKLVADAGIPSGDIEDLIVSQPSAGEGVADGGDLQQSAP